VIGARDYTFADLFAGTGVVGYHFAKLGKKVVVNDTLFSNVVAYKAWFGDTAINNQRISEVLNLFNKVDIKALLPNYFSQTYGGKYYTVGNAKAIGFIREQIELIKNEISEREYYVLLASLLYYADKIANTVGHFEHYLSAPPKDRAVCLEPLQLERNINAEILNEDANTLAKKLAADVVYIDPPYNARQYVNFYHVLENLARWNKPNEFEGVSMKFKRDGLKSGYCRVKAPILFSDLIHSLHCRLIIVSYNNTYTAKSSSSNNRIQETFLADILNQKGTTIVKEIPYKAFNAGNTDFKKHLEKLYICEVTE